jgi:hypothetical protein
MKTQMSIMHMSIPIGKIPAQSIYDKILIELCLIYRNP